MITRRSRSATTRAWQRCGVLSGIWAKEIVVLKRARVGESSRGRAR